MVTGICVLLDRSAPDVDKEAKKLTGNMVGYHLQRPVVMDFLYLSFNFLNDSLTFQIMNRGTKQLKCEPMTGISESEHKIYLSTQN